MVALHGTDPATIFLSAIARTSGDSVEPMLDAMYDDRSLVRVMAMRRTLFVASRSAMPVLERSSAVDVAATERKRLERFLRESNINDPTAWLAAAAVEVVEAIPAQGAPARTLTKSVPRLQTRITMGAGTNHQVEAGATSRVLGLMAVEGLLVRGRPSGDWTTRQYNWHTRQQWLDETAPPALDPNAAAIELVRRWLSAFGPAPFDDIKWWTGWTVRKLKPVLEAIDTVDVELDDGSLGLVLADDLGPTPPPEPWAQLLPSLDPTPMGWKERAWYLGDHEAPLFDRFGNIGPTVWLNGRIIGGWGQQSDGEVVIELLEDVGAEAAALIDARVERMKITLDDTIVKPSFPAPLQKSIRISGV